MIRNGLMVKKITLTKMVVKTEEREEVVAMVAENGVKDMAKILLLLPQLILHGKTIINVEKHNNSKKYISGLTLEPEPTYQSMVV